MKLNLYNFLFLTFLIFIIFQTITSISSCKDEYSFFPPYGIRFDPEILQKSGGMAGFSTYPVDTSPEGGGYINFPYVSYNSYFNPYYYPQSLYDYDYPLFYDESSSDEDDESSNDEDDDFYEYDEYGNRYWLD